MTSLLEVCHNVSFEPQPQPRLTVETFPLALTNVEDGARLQLDVAFGGFL